MKVMQSIEERLYRAVQVEKKGYYDRAVSEYLSIIRDKTDFKEAYLNLGALYSRMSELKKAVLCYKKAISLGEDYLTFFNLGSVFYKNGDYKKAVLSLDRSRRLKRDFALSILVMGLCFSRLKNFKAAEACFLEVLAIQPANSVALTALAIIYIDKRKYTRSLELLNKIITLDTENKRVRKLKANVLYHLNRIDESANEIKYIKNYSDNFKCYDEFIQSIPNEIYTDKYGTIDKKIYSIQKSVKKTSDRKSLITLSLCYILKGETDIAIDYLFEARKGLHN
jgi:tetratricopeptide (TPR) repeat protein